MDKFIKLQDLPNKKEINLVGVARKMETRDIPHVYNLYKTHHEKHSKWSIKYNQEELANLLMPRKGVVNTLVIENSEKKEITDFVSYFTVGVTITNNNTHTALNGAYLYYYSFSEANPLRELVRLAISQAKDPEDEEDVAHDTFSLVTFGQNYQIIEDLRFNPGDGFLTYYMWNYQASNFDPKSIGLVLF